MVKLITEYAINEINELVDNSEKSIKIICPFLGLNTSRHLARTIKRHQLSAKIITRFSRHDFYCKASSILGLKELCIAGSMLKAVSNLHTKLYIFDDKYIIIGSSNYTRGGLVTNIELNVLIKDEKAIVNRAIDYFNEIDTNIEKEYVITSEMIEDEIKVLESLVADKDSYFDERKDKGKRLELRSRKDFIEKIVSLSEGVDVLGRKSTAWLKFEGFSDERRTKNDEALNVEINEENCYRTHFPKRPTGYKNGDIIFIARNSWDLAGQKTPIVFGYGITKKFQPSNVATDAEKENENLVRWPFYIYVENFRYIKSTLADGISLLDLYKEVGSATYPGAKERNSSFEELKKVHSQKDKLQITDEAKEYLLTRLNEIL